MHLPEVSACEGEEEGKSRINLASDCSTVQRSGRKNENIVWQNVDITKELREKLLGQRAFTVWMTGLSGAGKSTLANELEKRLFAMGKHTMLLDGDNIRMGLNKNLGFTENDRIENIRRIAEVAKLLNDAGIIVVTAFISPFRQDRRKAKEIIGDAFKEVYISTPLRVCEKRDVKGLYLKAKRGEIRNFTGISSRYEEPENPDIVVNTEGQTLEESVETILEGLKDYLGEK